MEKNLVKQESASPAELIKVAMDKGSDMDKLEKLLNIQMRWEENEAKKEYHIAMAKFKANPPKIDKDKNVKYKEVKYSHASLYNVTEKINAELSKHGLSAAWTTTQSNNTVTVNCTITHSKGHSESTSLTSGPDDTGSKNKIQAIGSAISYLQRYTLLSLTGLATHDMDDDAKAVEIEYITDQELSIVLDLIDSKALDQTKFCKYMGIEEVGQIPRSEFKKAETVLIQAKDNTK